MSPRGAEAPGFASPSDHVQRERNETVPLQRKLEIGQCESGQRWRKHHRGIGLSMQAIRDHRAPRGQWKLSESAAIGSAKLRALGDEQERCFIAREILGFV